MITRKYLDDTFPTLTQEDTGQTALELMSDVKSSHLPVLEGKHLLGILSEEDVLLQDYNNKIGECSISYNKVSIDITGHVLEGVRLMAEHKLSILPVIDEEQMYAGSIKEADVLQVMYQSFCLVEKGATIVLEMPSYKYSLAEIAQILESEGIQIYFSSISSNRTDGEKIQLHIKTNKENLESLIPTFERYEIEVVELINEETFSDSMKERYASLMSYLNV